MEDRVCPGGAVVGGGTVLGVVRVCECESVNVSVSAQVAGGGDQLGKEEDLCLCAACLAFALTFRPNTHSGRARTDRHC